MTTIIDNTDNTDNADNTDNTDCAKCSRCGASMYASDGDIDDILKVLETVHSRADAPNANVCRNAIRNAFGAKRARFLVNALLEDRVISATKAYHRRHVLMLNRQPLRPIQTTA